MRLEDLLRDIEGEVPGAPEPVMLRELRDAAFDFCRSTGIWREQLEPVLATSGWAEYEFAVPFWARLEKALWGYYGDSRLRYADEQAVREQNHRQSNTGQPRTYALVRGNRNAFVVTPTPGDNETDSFHFFALLVPARDADEIPDWLGAEWQDALVSGALSRLLRQRAEWGEPNLAQMHGQQYSREKARAKREAMTGYGAQTRVKPQSFGA